MMADARAYFSQLTFKPSPAQFSALLALSTAAAPLPYAGSSHLQLTSRYDGKTPA